MKNSHSIKHWPRSEQPREKLLSQGEQSLSDAELLAVLIRNGSQGKDALSFSRELIQRYGGLRKIFHLPVSELKKIKGFGEAKISTLRSVIEIAQRVIKEDIKSKSFNQVDSLINYLYLSMRDRAKEIFKVLFLNSKKEILSDENLFQGSLDRSAVYPREVLQRALDCEAAFLVLVHNHPSGKAFPSEQDKRITRKLQMACSSVSIGILDHIIIGDDNYFSFCEQNLL